MKSPPFMPPKEVILARVRLFHEATRFSIEFECDVPVDALESPVFSSRHAGFIHEANLPVGENLAWKMLSLGAKIDYIMDQYGDILYSETESGKKASEVDREATN